MASTCDGGVDRVEEMRRDARTADLAVDGGALVTGHPSEHWVFTRYLN